MGCALIPRSIRSVEKYSAKLALHFTELSQVPDDTPKKQQHQKVLITGRVSSSNPKKERKKKPEKICCVSQTFYKRGMCRDRHTEREREREREREKKKL